MYIKTYNYKTYTNEDKNDKKDVFMHLRVKSYLTEVEVPLDCVSVQETQGR